MQSEITPQAYTSVLKGPVQCMDGLLELLQGTGCDVSVLDLSNLNQSMHTVPPW